MDRGTGSPGRKTLFIIIFFYAALSFLNYSLITEDAFIFFRVAEYLYHGYGCVFNPGERTEVCSSLSWLFLLTVLRALGANILTASKMAGIMLGCCSLVIIYKITSRYTATMPWVILPALLTSLSLPFLMWNQMGLETPLYTLVFLSLILVCLNRRSCTYWPLPAIMLVLTRPEGLFLLAGMLPAFYHHRGKRLLTSIALFTCLYLAVMTIRFSYFHDFVPSTFYAKMYAGKYAASLNYLHRYLADYYCYYFCACLLFFLWRKWNWQEQRSILFGFIAVYLLWVVLGGAETKPFYRHIVPLIPLLYIYIITGMAHVCGDLSKSMKFALSAGMLAYGCAGLALPVNYSFRNVMENPVAGNFRKFFESPTEHARFIANRIKDPASHNYIELKDLQLFIGEFVRENYYGGTTLVYDQMGQAPYLAGIDYYFIDSWGLTDMKIGRYYFHEKVKDSFLLHLYAQVSSSFIRRFFPREAFINSEQDMLDYIFARNPDVIMLVDQVIGLSNFLPHWLLQDQRFKEQYRLKYYISTTFIYEKVGLRKKPLYIPEGFTITRK